MLATEWTVAEDGKEVTFTLRDDVTFNDGSAFDAETVKANFERAKSIESSMVLPVLETVDSVEVVSQNKDKFVLHSSNTELAAILSGPAGVCKDPAEAKIQQNHYLDTGTHGAVTSTAQKIPH